ncbi:MAG: hypothetical protein IBX53_13745, partial [Halomonas sp.]|uniref:hypothetical protein n=1 Tax=Halomonas sp. TaxID=1486246 RepID=UPI0019EDCD75
MAFPRREPRRLLRRLSGRLLRPLVGLVLLVGLAGWLEPAAILAQVQQLSPGWALLAMALLTLAVLAASPFWHELMARGVKGMAASG